MKSLIALLCSLLFATAALAQAPLANDSTFQGLGGKQGINNIVGTFIKLVLADDRINANFKDTDKKNLAMRLSEQFCQLSGGPCTYGGKSMVDIHDGLNVTTAQFNVLTEALQTAMETHGVSSAVQNRLVAKLAPMHRDIVIKK
jgi:hemoglobin